jgi:hypothetical protein
MTEKPLANIINNYYSNWKNAGSFMLYKNDLFQFRSSIIIVELDYCLINYITNKKLHNMYSMYEIEINKSIVHYLKKESKDKSIIIISSDSDNGKMSSSSVKKKIEHLNNCEQLPLLALFSTKKNKFCKPHTGIFKLLKYYFRKTGNVDILKTIVISHQGGDLIEKESKEGTISYIIKFSDKDRAFAHNIGAEYISLETIVNNNTPKFRWNTKIIEPNVRQIYKKEIEKHNLEITNGNANCNKELINWVIFKELYKYKNVDNYLIGITGAPRSGKTRLATQLMEMWDGSEIGKTHSVKILNIKTQKRLIQSSIKSLSERMSVIIDGNFNTETTQKAMNEYCNSNKISFILIEVNPGLEMARLFNHVAIENSLSEDDILYNNDVYDLYKATYSRPDFNGEFFSFIEYYPFIDDNPSVMGFRY